MTDLPAQIRAGMATLIAARTATMLDTCTATRSGSGQTPVLDADGSVTTPNSTVVYTGPCTFVDPKMPPRRMGGGGLVVNDEAGSPEQRQLRVPHTANLSTGDLVTVTSSAFSPGLVGDRFLVVREDERSYATYRAYILRGSAWQAPV